MKYYSDVTNEFYGSEKQCKEAEEKALADRAKKEQKRKLIEAEKKARLDEINETYEKYITLVKDYIKNYGSITLDMNI